MLTQLCFGCTYGVSMFLFPYTVFESMLAEAKHCYVKNLQLAWLEVKPCEICIGQSLEILRIYWLFRSGLANLDRHIRSCWPSKGGGAYQWLRQLLFRVSKRCLFKLWIHYFMDFSDAMDRTPSVLTGFRLHIGISMFYPLLSTFLLRNKA